MVCPRARTREARARGSVRLDRVPGGQLQVQGWTIGIDGFHLSLEPASLVAIDGNPKGAMHIRRNRALVASLRNHLPPTLEVLFALKAGHILGPQPARLAVELMLAQCMTRDQVNLMALIDGRSATWPAEIPPQQPPPSPDG